MSPGREESWETEITHDGLWPTPWCWRVVRRTPDYRFDSRSGSARTRGRAQAKAIRARLSMEREDLRIVESA